MKQIIIIIIIIIVVLILIQMEYGSLDNWLVDNLTHKERFYLIYLIYIYRFFKKLLKVIVHLANYRDGGTVSLFKHHVSEIQLKIHEENDEYWSRYYPKDLITINSTPDQIVFVDGLVILKLSKFSDDMKQVRKLRKPQKSTDFWIDSINSTAFRINLIEILSQLEPGLYIIFPYLFIKTRGKVEALKVYNHSHSHSSTSDLKLSVSKSGYVNNVKFFISVKDGKLSNEEIMSYSTSIIFKLANFIKQYFNVCYDLEKDSILIIQRIDRIAEKPQRPKSMGVCSRQFSTLSNSTKQFHSRGYSTDSSLVHNPSINSSGCSSNVDKSLVTIDEAVEVNTVTVDVGDIEFDYSLLNVKTKNEKVVNKIDLCQKIELRPGFYLEISLELTDANKYNCKGLSFKLKPGLSELEVIQMVSSILSEMESISKKGFIVPGDLKFTKMLIFKEVSRYLLKNELEIEIEGINVSLFKESYNWMCNLIYLNLYRLMLKNLNHKGMDSKVEDSDADDLVDYKNLMLTLQSKLDPSIRIKMNKPGLGVIQNVYTGFDTEYKHREKIYNDLISVQMAVNTRTYIKIPKAEDFYVCKIETLSSKRIPIQKIEGFRYDILENNIVDCIGEIRSIKCKKYDIIMHVLYTSFKELCKNKPDLFSSYEKGDYLIVSLPRTPIEKYVYLNDNKEGFTLADLLSISNDMGNKYLKDDYSKIRHILKNIKNFYDGDCELDSLFPVSSMEHDLTVVNTRPDKSTNEIINRYSRSKMRSMEFNINIVKNNYIIAHLTNADLSMLGDFEDFKDSLDIVNRSFVTLGKPIKYNSSNVYIRDTMLLAPAGKKGLAALGDLLGFSKGELSLDEITSMDKLLINDREKFLSYAVRDAVIPLLYASYMEDQLFKSRSLGIPISLSSLSAAYVRDEWDKEGYAGYQIDPQYLIGDSGATQTPKGLYKTDDVGRKISMFIASYRGGRNESYMYGVDNNNVWFDYDLTSAYTSAMAILGNPKYSASRNLSKEELNDLNNSDLINNYIVMSVKFSFPKSIKYPSIACYLNENTTIYPLEGVSVITGVEYLLAKEQGCEFKNIKDIFMIPFETDSEGGVINQPFREIIKELQNRRIQYPKKSLGNLMEKEKGNSIYGNVVRGTSNKKKFDIKTGRTIRLEGSVLTNPILASWTTAFIRSVVGECLHNIDLLGGKVVSVTTDGFITDLEGLESKIVRGDTNILLKKYRSLRKFLSVDCIEDALELKTSGKGVISWTTRGQFSLDGKILAATGFQTKGLLKEDLECLFKNTLSGEDRIIEFIQGSLRSAKDLYMQGGQVTKIYADRIFRLEFDNKRVLNIPVDLKNGRDFSNVLLDSSPPKNVESVDGLRFLSSYHKSLSYNRMTSGVGRTKYVNNLDLAIRNFVKACIKETPGYNLQSFDNYQELINFVKSYKPSYKISKSSISNLKNRKLVVKGVPKNPDTLAFVEYVKLKFPEFNVAEFFES